MKKKILIIVMIATLFVSNISFGMDIFQEETAAILLGDYETGELLYAYNIDESLGIASVTKLMTYLVAMDAVEKGEVSLDDWVVISHNAASVSGSNFNLVEGESVLFSDLLKAVLIVSGNDAAVAVAEHVGGSEELFVLKMNSMATQIGLLQSYFTNPHGLTNRVDGIDTPYQNRMSANDVFKLSRYLIDHYPEILEITSQEQLVVDYRNFKKKNTNPLLKSVPGADGLKTGYTKYAGFCLTSTYEIESSDLALEDDFRMIGVVLGSQSGEARKYISMALLGYGEDHFRKEKVLNVDRALGEVPLYAENGARVEVFPTRDCEVILDLTDELDIEVAFEEIEGNKVKSGTNVGKAKIYRNGKLVDAVPLEIRDDVNF